VAYNAWLTRLIWLIMSARRRSAANICALLMLTAIWLAIVWAIATWDSLNVPERWLMNWSTPSVRLRVLSGQAITLRQPGPASGGAVWVMTGWPRW